jgi:hypothetical protein
MPHGNRPPLRGQYDQEVNMPNLLDDLFQWAAQQPARNTTTVDLAMTGNQITGNDITQNNLVTYGVGTLYYDPPHQAGGIFHFPAYFASQTDGITQYFSNRKFGGGPLGGTNPFNPDDTDPLDITIGRSLFSSNYDLTAHSSKYDTQFTVGLNFDTATEIIYATSGPTFFTVSLCGRNSVYEG